MHNKLVSRHLVLRDNGGNGEQQRHKELLQMHLHLQDELDQVRNVRNGI
jgi:hypothetical protein